MKPTASARDIRIIRVLGWFNLAVGSGFLLTGALIRTMAFFPAGVAMTTVGVSVLSIARTYERNGESQNGEEQNR